MAQIFCKKHIRQQMRQYRQQVTYQQQIIATDQITHLVLKQTLITSARHFGIFLPFDGEINTKPLIIQLLTQKKKFTYQFYIL